MTHTKTPQEQLNDDAFYQQEAIITNLRVQNAELLEALKAVNMTLHNHGHMDADTGLHSKIEQAIKKAEK